MRPLLVNKLKEFFPEEFRRDLFSKPEQEVEEYLALRTFVQGLRSTRRWCLWCCPSPCVFSADLLRAEKKAKEVHEEVVGFWSDHAEV